MEDAISYAPLDQFLRHTGAGCLLLSGTTGDDQLILRGWQLHPISGQDHPGFIITSPLDLEVVGMSPHISEKDVRSWIKPLLELLSAQARDLGFGSR
jgi:hypothetical protein